MNEHQISVLVDRFFELMGQEAELNTVEQAEVSLIIRQLGLSEADLRDLAAQCMRRAIYLNNTQQPA